MALREVSVPAKHHDTDVARPGRRVGLRGRPGVTGDNTRSLERRGREHFTGSTAACQALVQV